MTMPIVRSILSKAWKNCITESICIMANSRANFDLHFRNNANTNCFNHNYSDLFSNSYYIDACKKTCWIKKIMTTYL